MNIFKENRTISRLTEQAAHLKPNKLDGTGHRTCRQVDVLVGVRYNNQQAKKILPHTSLHQKSIPYSKIFNRGFRSTGTHKHHRRFIVHRARHRHNKQAIHPDKAWKHASNGEDLTHYRVLGGPMMVTCHSKTLLSSTSPAENPSTRCFARSTPITIRQTNPKSIRQTIRKEEKKLSGNRWTGTPAGRTSELLL